VHSLKRFRFSNPNPTHPKGRPVVSLPGNACSFNPYFKFIFFENRKQKICHYIYALVLIKFNSNIFQGQQGISRILHKLIKKDRGLFSRSSVFFSIFT